MLDAFKNLQLLWFLPLAVLPILLHLLTQYRLRTVELSTFRFLLDSYVQQRRRIRLFEWLLLLLRTAVVALIIFALSRPEVSSLGWLFRGQGGGEVVCILDAGPSMGLRSGGTSSMERARSVARSMLEQFGADTRVTLIRAADRPQVLASRFAVQRDAIIDQIDRIVPSAADGDLAAAIELVYPEDTDPSPRRVYLISDLHRSGWSRLAGHPVLARIGPADQITVIDVGSARRMANLSVSGRAASTPRPVMGLPVVLNATVVNGSDSRPAHTILSLILDDQQVDRATLSLEPGQRITRTFTVTPNRPGVIRGRFELPHDAFDADDTFYFSLNVASSINVLIAAPPPSPQSDKPSATHDGNRSESYVLSALRSPLTAAERRSSWQSRIAAALSITTVADSELNAGQLATADVVVLADVPLDPARGRLLQRYVDAGGGLLVLPGAHVQAESYQQHLLVAAALNGQPSIHLGEPVGNPDDESTFATIGRFERSHPVFSAFDEADARFFATTRLYRYFPITTSNDARATSLMRLSDQTVVLAEARIGDGTVLLAGFAATPDFSNLPLKPEFVPLLLRAAAYLCRPPLAESPGSVEPNAPAVFRIADRWPRAQLEVVDPAGKPHPITLHRSGTHLVGAMLHTDLKGYYTAHILPRAQDAPQQVELGFAVNLDTDGTDLATFDEQQLRGLWAPIEPAYVRGVPDDPVLARRLSDRREVWRALIAIMFAVIFFEFLLATLKPRTAAAPEAGAGRFGRLGRILGRMGFRDIGLRPRPPGPAPPAEGSAVESPGFNRMTNG